MKETTLPSLTPTYDYVTTSYQGVYLITPVLSAPTNQLSDRFAAK